MCNKTNDTNNIMNNSDFAGPLALGRVKSLKTFQYFNLPFQTLQLASFLLSFLFFLDARVAAPGTPASTSTNSLTAMMFPDLFWPDFFNLFLPIWVTSIRKTMIFWHRTKTSKIRG